MTTTSHRSTRHAARRFAVVAVCTLGVGSGSLGCKKTEPPPPPPAPSAPPKPVDHVAPGELLEGTESAFGLVLPRDTQVTGRLTRQTTGEIYAPPENVANYVRARVGDGKITMGTTTTTFSSVRPKADPTRVIDVRVERTRSGSRLDVMEVVVTSEPPPPTKAGALKKAGLQANGRPDPQMQ